MMKNNFSVVASLLFLIAVLFFLLHLIFRDIHKTNNINQALSEQVARQRIENSERAEYNNILKKEVLYLNDPVESLVLIEEEARESYGMIKLGEIKFYLSEDIHQYPDIEGLDELLVQELTYKFSDVKKEIRPKKK